MKRHLRLRIACPVMWCPVTPYGPATTFLTRDTPAAAVVSPHFCTHTGHRGRGRARREALRCARWSAAQCSAVRLGGRLLPLCGVGVGDGRLWETRAAEAQAARQPPGGRSNHGVPLAVVLVRRHTYRPLRPLDLACASTGSEASLGRVMFPLSPTGARRTAYTHST